ncbi:MAG: methyltransferase domain-containing protein [Alphaproteobacteria bacterium]|nr:MAG: methyltransferase domain-containing protein [Alphaproteobacteria bacterium]
MSLAARLRREEQMDNPALDPAVYDRVLLDLGRVNVWTFAARPTLSFLKRAAKGRKRFRLLDVGFGDGGMLRAIARWAERRGIEAELVGVDLNPKSAATARAATPEAMRIDYRTGDYHDQEGSFDLVVSSLVAHHMTDDQLLEFLRWMEGHSALGWFVNDLHRHPLAYHSFPLLTTLLRSHRIVREDGRLSIARSFRPAEWQAILSEAGVRNARVRRYFPFRLCVERLR